MFAQVTSISEFLSLWLSHELLPPAEQAVLLTYYSSYKRHFPPRLKYYYDRQTQEVVDLIHRQPQARVMEIGCGTGTESLWMALQGARVHAIELTLDRYKAALARKRVLEADLGKALDCEFSNVSMLDLDGTNTYDIIWMEQAFHHLEPREEVVRKVVRLLRPGGHLVVSEANSLNPLLQMQVLSQRGFKTVKTFQDHTGRVHQYGDERILSATTLARLFSQHGIECASTEHFRLFPNHPVFDSWLSLEKTAPKWIRPLFSHYNYVGRKHVQALQVTAA
jgi:2-polyprenyl-3-methyl-5-hydroxy-6-metoxy-1,4-benzoquinol methylase